MKQKQTECKHKWKNEGRDSDTLQYGSSLGVNPTIPNKYFIFLCEKCFATKRVIY